MNEKTLESATRELNLPNGMAQIQLSNGLNAVRRRLEVLQALEVRTPTCFTVSNMSAEDEEVLARCSCACLLCARYIAADLPVSSCLKQYFSCH